MAAFVAGLGAAIVGVVQLRAGIIHLLDTVTYWSGAQAVADGHPFTTRLAPSFSNFDVVEFLGRGGRLPFVDFPVGYPLLAGIPGALIGVRHSMGLVVISSLAVLAACLVIGDISDHDRRNRRASGPRITAVAFAVLLVIMPTSRLVTQGTLSEPIFTASVFALVISLVRYRDGGRWRWVVIFTVAASLLRFIGAPLALLGGWERYHRTRDARRSIVWTIALAAPAATNIAASSLAGGGHNAGWRGLQKVDVDVFVRSIGGWFDHRQGDLRRTYFTAEGPQWWSWLVAIAWIALLSLAVVQLIRRRPFLTPTAHLALGAAAIISAGLVAGLLGFDALVIPDNRLMLPAGLLTLAALFWSRPRGKAWTPAMVVVVLIWTFVAVDPAAIGERFSDDSGRKAFSDVAAESGARITVSNDADAVHWDTGLSSVYAPTSVKALTGETVDVEDLYRRLPCALLENDGVVVLSDEVTFSSVDYDLLDLGVVEGSLTKEDLPGAIVYRPTSDACR
ncbi:MAG: hypothetical protein RL391_259 [Actinomycetota bacterium]|jgi:hypothetical protein